MSSVLFVDLFPSSESPLKSWARRMIQSDKGSDLPDEKDKKDEKFSVGTNSENGMWCQVPFLGQKGLSISL